MSLYIGTYSSAALPHSYCGCVDVLYSRNCRMALEIPLSPIHCRVRLLICIMLIWFNFVSCKTYRDMWCMYIHWTKISWYSDRIHFIKSKGFIFGHFKEIFLFDNKSLVVDINNICRYIIDMYDHMYLW